MLVLSRCHTQWIDITVGTTVVSVQVVGLRSDKVRLGIQAPPDVRVMRREVQERIDAGEIERAGRETRPEPEADS